VKGDNVKTFRRSRRLLRLASCAALALGLGGGALATSGAAQARPVRTIPSRSLAVGWGRNFDGQLGNGSTDDSATAVGVSGLAEIAQVSAGYFHSLALTSGGFVWAWGYNGQGELGNGSTTDGAVPLPVEVTGLPVITKVATGWGSSLALASDGTVWAWGENQDGELGNGSTANSDKPVQVAGLTGVVQIAAGSFFDLALRSDGTVGAWGDNTFGELGNGGTANSDVPVQVTGLSRVTQIAAGGNVAMVARTQGFITSLTTVWTWGDNSQGQLGDGTTTNRSTPEEVSGISVPGVRQIAVGGTFSLVLGSDGSVWGWGGDYDSQLGNAATYSWTRPVETIGMDSGITQIAAGFLHALALRSDGTVLAWGDDQSGEIGNGTTSGSPTLPTEVTGLTNVTQVSAGAYFSLAVHTVYGFPLRAIAPNPAVRRQR
jgi:alpha-tubulin suppressor-like RCC1 family protein